MAIGAKQIETRHWRTSYRGPLLIHAAKKRDVASLRLCLEEPFRSVLKDAGIRTIGDIPLGKILCSVHLTECREIRDNYMGPDLPHGIPLPSRQERAFGNYAPGRFAWMTVRGVRLLDPIPFKGAQGIFNVPDSVWDDAMES